jgi:hypothetical protein
MALRNAGWRMARDFAIDDQVCDFPNFRWAALNAYPVEIVNLKVVPTYQQILDRIHTDDAARASSDKLIATIEDIYQLLGHRLFGEIDLVLEHIDLKRTAPEYSVGLLRTTSKDVRHIRKWHQFLNSVQQNLLVRGLDPQQILIGLL